MGPTHKLNARDPANLHHFCLDHISNTLDQAEYLVAGLLEYSGPTHFQKAKLSENVYTGHVSVRVPFGQQAIMCLRLVVKASDCAWKTRREEINHGI